MTTLMLINLTCPVCNTHFESRSVSVGEAIAQETDFRKVYEGQDPLPFQVHVCPHCHFCAFEGDFSTTEDAVRSHILSGGLTQRALMIDDRAEEMSGSFKYLLAAACYEHDSRATKMRLADLYLRAAWCARTEHRIQRERECQIEALLRFEIALTEELVDEAADPGQRETVLYLLGELYRRIGRFELSLALFSAALDELRPETEESFVSLLRRQQMMAELRQARNMMIE